MATLHGIKTVARTEAKMFARSWLFRFLMVFTVVVIGFLSWLYYFMGYGGWMIRSIPSFFPYFITLSLTVFESLIVIFGSIESMQRDTHLNTFASLHARDITNFGYITGKIIGMLRPCAILSMVVLSAGAVMNVFFITDTPFVLTDYVIYPLLILVPALVFITGLSFLVTGLVKSTPLALLLLVGYFALTFLYRDGIFARVIDFMAIQEPLLSSSIIGFGNLDSILLQRSVFFFFGITFILGAGIIVQRLPQSMSSIRISRNIAIACVVVAFLSVTLFVNGITRGIQLREHIVALNKEYVNKPRARLTDCDLDINHQGSSLDVEATLNLKNQRDKAMTSVVLSLNPGFTVRSVTDGDVDLAFTRDTQIIEVTLPAPLDPGKEAVLTVTYDGTINDEACYPDIATKDHLQSNRVFTYVIDKRYGFITSDYVLLTPECQWYPSSGIPNGLVFPDAYERDFADFSVNVTTRDDLTVVSQGAVASNGSNSYTIRSETPLPGLTLAIGEYEKKALDVDGVEISIYHLPDHDFFAKDFRFEIEDIRTQLQDVKFSYEKDKGMLYPFSRFSLVESPVQFYSMERKSKTSIETTQPQMAIVPEMGFYIPELDIQEFKNSQTIEFYEEEGIPTDGLSNSFARGISNIAKNIFMGDHLQRNSSQEIRSQRSSLIKSDFFKNPLGQHYRPGYDFSTQFFPFIISFESDRYPILNTAMEFYRKYGINIYDQFIAQYRSQSIKALTDEETACIALSKNTFENYMNSDTDFDTFYQLLILKSNHLFGMIQGASERIGFDKFLNEYIIAHAYEHVNYVEFAEVVNHEFGVDFDTILENWYRDTQLPLFEVSDIVLTELIDGEYTCYQSTLTVTNIESVTGTIKIDIVTSTRETGIQHDIRFVTLDGHQSKQVGFVTDVRPGICEINTLISKNLPREFSQTTTTLHEDHDIEPFEGERIVDYVPNEPDPGTVVVDNLDAGFEIVSNPADIDDGEYTSRYKYGEAPNDFIPPIFDPPPKRWGKAVVQSAYGTQKVAYFTQSESGDGKVVWHADIPEAGQYDLEYYMCNPSRDAAKILGQAIKMTALPSGNLVPVEKQKMLEDYHLTVTNGGQASYITFMPTENQPGWQYVSTMDLKAGQTDVSLSNKSEGTLIYADAIRWVKK